MRQNEDEPAGWLPTRKGATASVLACGAAATPRTALQLQSASVVFIGELATCRHSHHRPSHSRHQNTSSSQTNSNFAETFTRMGESRSLRKRRPRVAKPRTPGAPAAELRSVSCLFLLVGQCRWYVASEAAKQRFFPRSARVQPPRSITRKNV